MAEKQQAEKLDYAEMYYTIFRAVTKAINAIHIGEYVQAERFLCEAQIKTEQMYLDAGETNPK